MSMTRRGWLQKAVGVLATAWAFLLWREPAQASLRSQDHIVVASALVLTRQEAERCRAQGPGALNALVGAKLDNLLSSAVTVLSDEVERRGWGVIEYATHLPSRD